MQSPDISKAISIYYSKLEIGTSDICNIFSCGRTKALKLKNIARNEMAKQGKRAFTPYHVSTPIAYKAWGLDIADLEGRLKKIKQLGI